MEPTVLIVDDEPDLLAEASEYLESYCGPVLTAARAQDALRLLLAHRSVRVVVLDLRMPGTTGFELIDQVRTQRVDGLPRFIVITGHAGPGEARRAETLGVDALLYKPFDLEALRQAVAQSLARAGALPPSTPPSDARPAPTELELRRLEARVDALETQLRRVLAELRDLKVRS